MPGDFFASATNSPIVVAGTCGPTTSDIALQFARNEFNAAVALYNEAVRQFPTVLVARLFGFRAAALF